MANYGPPGGPYPGPPSEPWPDPNPQADEEYGQPADPWGDHDQPGSGIQSGSHGQPAGSHSQSGGGQPSAPPAGSGSPVGYPGYPDPTAPVPPGPPAGPEHYPDPDHPPTRRQDVRYPTTPHQPGGSAPFATPPAGWTPPSGSDPVWAPQAGEPNWSSSALEPARKRGGGRVLVGVLATLAVLVVGGAAIGVYLFGQEQEPAPDARPTAGPTDGPAYQSSPPAGPTPTRAVPEPSTDARFVKVGQCVANEGSEEAPQLTITVCAPQTYEVLARYNGATTGEADAKRKCAKVQNYTNFYFFSSDLDELDYVLCLKER